MTQPPPCKLRRATDKKSEALSRSFGDALRIGDGAVAEGVVRDALKGGLSPDVIQSLVIQPAMVRVGELWETRHLTVADEHLATSISQRSLLPLFEALRAQSPPAKPGVRVLLAGPEGQHHVLGLRMVADVLEGAGFDVIYLGGDVPAQDLAESVIKHRPDVVGLTFGISTSVRHLADCLWAIHAATPAARIILGGDAVPAGLREVYPYVANSMEVLGVIESVLASPPQELPAVVESLRTDGPQAIVAGTRPAESDHIAARLASAADQAVEIGRDQARLAAQYRDLAFRDPLTELPNRRALEEELIERADQPGTDRGVILMIDVDSFKAINDGFGHQVGDQLLRDVAEKISRSIRPGDLAARVGGDEFVGLLPDASVAEGEVVAERILTAVAEEVVPPVTVSIGVGELTSDSRRTLLDADEALYDAKEAGRNRVVVPDSL